MQTTDNDDIEFEACGYGTIARVEYHGDVRVIMLQQESITEHRTDVVLLPWADFEELYRKLRMH